MNRDLFLSILAIITVTVAAFPFLNYDCSVAISSAPLQRKRAPSFLYLAKDSLQCRTSPASLSLTSPTRSGPLSAWLFRP